MNSKTISISAISAGFIALFLTLGAYIELIDLITVVLSSIFVLLPLYKNSYLGSILAYLAGVLIAFIFSGFNIFSLVFPAFLLFFGVYPIVKNYVIYKNGKTKLAYVLSLIWCIAVFYGLYFFIVYVQEQPFTDLPDFIAKYILVFVGLAGALFFVVFDKFIYLSKRIMDSYLQRIIK